MELEKTDIKQRKLWNIHRKSCCEKKWSKGTDLRVKAMSMRGTEMLGERMLSTYG